MRFSSGWEMTGRVIGAALMGACAFIPPLAASSLVSQSISLELIVKFSDDSDAGRQIRRVIDEQSGDATMLAQLQEQLRQSTGFVLIPERITSGKELILSVPEEPPLERVKQAVTRRPEIASAELIATESKNPRLPESILVVHFREAGDEHELLQKALVDSAYGARVQALATELCAESGVPVLGSARAGAALAVTLDRFALVEMLTARLNALNDVDYAQPNATVQFMK